MCVGCIRIGKSVSMRMGNVLLGNPRSGHVVCHLPKHCWRPCTSLHGSGVPCWKLSPSEG